MNFWLLGTTLTSGERLVMLRRMYEAGMKRNEGRPYRSRFVDIAHKWNVALKQITKDQAKIAAMVKKRAEEIRREED